MTAPETFPRLYVEELRKRGDGYRRRANVAAAAAIKYAIDLELLKQGFPASMAPRIDRAGVVIDEAGHVIGVEKAVRDHLNSL